MGRGLPVDTVYIDTVYITEDTHGAGTATVATATVATDGTVVNQATELAERFAQVRVVPPAWHYANRHG